MTRLFFATTLLQLSLCLSVPVADTSLNIRQDQDLFNYCPASAWPPTGAGYTITSAIPDSELQAALSEISAANIQSYILKLVSFGTRHTLSDQTSPTRGIGAARNWVEAKMREFAAESNGRMIVTVPSYIQGVDGDRITFPVNISDIVATLPGSETPDRYYVVSGHYDSRVTDILNYESDAPGADDDASGVAVSMELARVMAKRRPRSTMVFSVVAGEEQDLYGSNFLAQTYKNTSVNVAGMLNNDIVGASVGSGNVSDPYSLRLFAQGPPSTENTTITAERLAIGGENDSPARELGRYVVENAQGLYTGMTRISMIYRLDRYLRGGDQLSYLTAGFPAVRFTEARENFAHQHQDVRVENGTQYGDLPEFVDFDYVARVAKVNLAAMYSMQAAPAIPRNVSVNATVLTNESTFYWAPGEEGDDGLAGFEVVWRSSDAPFWTNAVFVGNVDTATVDVSKDDVVFGVRSVGKNGYKSPAAFGGFPSD